MYLKNNKHWNSLKSFSNKSKQQTESVSLKEQIIEIKISNELSVVDSEVVIKSLLSYDYNEL